VAERPLPPASLRAGLRAATAVTRALGPLRYTLADAVGLGVYALQPERRRRATANHRRARTGRDDAEARRWARRSFREYGRTTVDFLWANHLDQARVRRMSNILGRDHIDAALDGGKGGVFALAHHGNWDMAANVATAYGIELTTVMGPVGTEWITELVVWAREQNQLEVFTPDNAARGLVRALRRNRFVCLLCDIPESGPTVVVDYCGGPVEFSAVPAWLALRTGTPVMPVECYRIGRRRYQIRCNAPVEVNEGDDEATVMQRVARVLEEGVHRHPGQWYPFRPFYADDR
jgi:phosphatidylinositol dimannoside acyltransferase